MKATSTPFASAFRATAPAQKPSMSQARAPAAPAFMAAMATRPEPVAKSSTRRPATIRGWSST